MVLAANPGDGRSSRGFVPIDGASPPPSKVIIAGVSRPYVPRFPVAPTATVISSPRRRSRRGR
eukprot:5197864-Lingulodinium_polyedra.AAC.1